nr:glucose-1-phosphate adenylyltransferase small subunit, chloroplastic/amyloplastic [Ipomoea trifida]
MSAAIGAPKLAPYTCAAERNDASALRAARFKSLSFASSNLSGEKLVSLVSQRCSRSEENRRRGFCENATGGYSPCRLRRASGASLALLNPVPAAATVRHHFVLS